MKSALLSSRIALIVGLTLLLALLLAASVIGVMRVDQVNRRLQEIVRAQDLKPGLVLMVFRAMSEQSSLAYRLFAEPDSSERAQAADRYRMLQGQRTDASLQIAAMPLTRAEREALATLQTAVEQERAVFERVVERAQAGDVTTARALFEGEGLRRQAEVQAALYQMLDRSRAALRDSVEEARDATLRTLMLIGVIGAFVLLGLSIIAVLAVRQVRRAQSALQHEKELAQVTLHSIGDGVITTDAAGFVEYMNPIAEQYTGWTTEQARGRPLAEIYRITDERTGKDLDPLVTQPQPASDDTQAVSVRLVDRIGGECPIRYSHAPIRNEEGRALGMIVVFHDISQIRTMAQQLLWQATHDALTGLVNRREFERRLNELIDTARGQSREHALMFMDLDNFKAVNDTCGHNAGDELLRQLTAVMLARMRGSDTLARLGGDEFAVALESCPFDQAVRIANAMRETIREFRFVWEDKTFTVGVSIGLVPITAESGNLNRLLSIADACCYEAKNKGRDRVQVYRPDADEASGKHSELEIVSQINQAFELGRFRLYRQRIQPLTPGARKEPNYEVLVRMIDATGNLVPPTAFMPAAERYNLLTSIERWVISSLIEYLHTQLAAGAIARDPAERGYYSVNLSGAIINDKSLPEFLGNLLRRYQLPAGLLCFEITETTAISNLTAAAELMRELKGMGCRFALDDFGTGMSSFAYLKYLPVDVLKIAGMFVRDMATDPMDYAIIDAINKIAHILGIQTVAEEVEDAQTLSKIKELRIDAAQGYFIQAPEELLHVPAGQPVLLESA